MQSVLLQLQNMQQTAIEIGTQIESVRGEGTQTVKCLEEICELVYKCSTTLERSEDFSENLKQLQNIIEKAEQFQQTEILDRKEAVFFIDKATHWQYMEWYWKKLLADDTVDIYIVPVPYHYKKYDGTCYASKLINFIFGIH